MAFTFAPAERPTTDSRGPTPGARALYKQIHQMWGYTTMMGIYNFRKVRGGKSLSHHAEGRGLDIGTPMIGGRADAPKGMAIVNAIGPIGKELGIEQIIYNRQTWSARSPKGRRYTGKVPHYDHIHVSLTRHAGANLTVEKIASLIGGAGRIIVDREEAPHPSASVERPTHKVSGVNNFLNLRSGPGVASSVLGRLDLGVGVEQSSDKKEVIEGTEWMTIRAIVGGSEVEGWVASKFLESTGAAPAPQKPTRKEETPKRVVGPSVERPTHTVSGVNEFLNLRSGPGVEASILGELDLGVGVERLGDETREVKGTEWVNIRAKVRDATVDGWVASKFLAPVGTTSTGAGTVGEKPTSGGLDPVTHRVSGVTNFLNMRSGPGVESAVVGELDLRDGVQLASNEKREIEGTEWTHIRAVVEGLTIEGWVASKFLEPVDA